MEKSSFFNAQLTGNTYDRVYKAEDIANYFSTFIGNGVFANPANSLQVISNEGTPSKLGMPITVKKGKAFINGYFYENTDDLTLYVNTANGILKRIDRVVARLDFLNREIKSYVLEGTPSANPVAPSITRNTDYYEIVLADITVNSGVTFIAQANIVDKRQDSSLCGIVKGTIEEIDTTDLFSQYTAQFEEWFNNLKNQLSNNQVTNLQAQIDALDTRVDDYDSFRTNGGQVGQLKINGRNLEAIGGALALKGQGTNTLSLSHSGNVDALMPSTNKGIQLGTQGNRFSQLHLGDTSYNTNTKTGYTSLPNNYYMTWQQVESDVDVLTVSLPITYPNKIIGCWCTCEWNVTRNSNAGVNITICNALGMSDRNHVQLCTGDRFGDDVMNFMIYTIGY